jgi:hypothetical protein
MSIAEFVMPFEAKLDENNRWVVLSQVITWDKFAELYYKNFPSRRGAPTKDVRMVLGVVIIKHMLKFFKHNKMINKKTILIALLTIMFSSCIDKILGH